MLQNIKSDTQPADLYHKYRKLAQGTNINSTTLLATDYLNHFNEIIMLLEMIPDMPECIEDVALWRPKSYVEHFQDSGFSDKELAIEAFAHSPLCYRVPFELTIAKLDKHVSQATESLIMAVNANDTATMQVIIENCQELRLLAEKAGGIIHGNPEAVGQAQIDAVLGAGSG